MNLSEFALIGLIAIAIVFIALRIFHKMHKAYHLRQWRQLNQPIKEMSETDRYIQSARQAYDEQVDRERDVIAQSIERSRQIGLQQAKEQALQIRAIDEANRECLMQQQDEMNEEIRKLTREYFKDDGRGV